jgi:hypothetical protein
MLTKPWANLEPRCDIDLDIPVAIIPPENYIMSTLRLSGDGQINAALQDSEVVYDDRHLHLCWAKKDNQ